VARKKKGNWKKVYICNTEWRLGITSDAIWHKGQTCYGLTDKHEQMMVVSSHGVAEDKIRSAILHELMHAVFETVTNTYPDDEETGVQALETGLYSFLRDKRNNWLIDLLLENR
jgi:Zn-dependent peptidase ImmA (M78 family)